MTNARPRRGGFSLIEILIVIALLALLAAIGVGAYLRVQAGAEVQATEGTLNKLNVGIMAKWKAVVDQVARGGPNSIPQPIRDFTNDVGGATPVANLDRARAVWLYMKLKNEFPTTSAEAGAITLGGYSLPARSIFSSITAGTAEERSAALLYASLVKGGVGGVTFDADPLRNQTKETLAGTVFVDTWGKPILFLRMAYAPDELNAAPYAPRSGFTSLDPCDPKGTLTRTTSNWDATKQSQFWAAVGATHYPYAGLPGSYPGSMNWIATPISAGPNGPDIADAGGGNPFADGNLFGGDNLVGFRLRKEGQRGD